MEFRNNSPFACIWPKSCPTFGGFRISLYLGFTAEGQLKRQCYGSNRRKIHLFTNRLRFQTHIRGSPNKDLLTNFLNSLFEEAEIASFPVSSYFPYAVWRISILSFKGLFLARTDGKTHTILDFSLHGEEGKSWKRRLRYSILYLIEIIVGIIHYLVIIH